MEPVGLQVRSPDVLGNISQILGIRQQQQALAGQQAEVQSAQQSQRQRSALASYDFSQHLDSEGLPDLNSLATDPKLRQAAGDQYLDVISKAASARQQQLENRGTLVSLRNNQRAAFGDLMGGLRSDPDVASDSDKGRQKVNEAMLQYGEMYGEDALPVLSAYSKTLQSVPKGKLAGALQAIQMQAVSAGNQVSSQRPEYTDSGPGLHQTNPNAVPGQQPDYIQKGVSPGYGLFVDPRTNNPYRVDNQTGRVSDLGGPAPSASPGDPPGKRPPNSMPKPYYPGQGGDVERYQAEVQSTRQAGDQAPLAANINRTILDLSRDAKTGPGSEKWQHAIGALGAPFGLSPSASYQEVGKFLEKNAIAQMTSMGGPPSDARLSAASAANGSTHFSPEALQAVTKFNDATTTALMQYRQGVDRSVGTEGNVDYTALPKFKAEWAKNFDVNIFRIENALRDGDKAELAKIKTELGPEGLKKLVEKRKKLNELSGG